MGVAQRENKTMTHQWEHDSGVSRTVRAWLLLTDGEVMSGGVDMSPKISNWLIF